MKASIKFKNIVAIVFITLSFFSLPLVAVWKKSKVIEMTRHNEILKEKKESLQAATLIHRYKLRTLQERSRIESIAIQDIGLKYPSHEDVVVLSVKEPKGRWGLVKLIEKGLPEKQNPQDSGKPFPEKKDTVN